MKEAYAECQVIRFQEAVVKASFTTSPGEPRWLRKGQRLVVWGLVEGGTGVSVQTVGQAEAHSTSQSEGQGGQKRMEGQDPI